MYRLILSDLDETLLVNHHVPKENQEAIQSLTSDVKFVPATGRAYNMIGEILKEIGTYNKKDEYSICFNGGLIVENGNDEILRFKGLSYELTKELYEESKKFDVCVLVFTLDCCYIFNADPAEVQRKIEQKASFKVCEDEDFELLRHEKIAKILYEKRDMDYLKCIEEQLRPLTKDRIATSFSSYRYLEMNALGVNKGEALKWLADYLHIDRKETIAIGDNYNDASMIEMAGLGVCVSSAVDEIKELSDYVTEHDYDEGAVKEVIDRFITGGE